MCGNVKKFALEQTAGADTATGTHKPDMDSILLLQFVLVTHAAHRFKEAICLSKAGRLRSVLVAKYSNRRGKGNNNVSVKQLLPGGKKKGIKSSF